MQAVDHIVYGVRDLDTGVADLERRLGVRATDGGKHVGRGTHNALLGLGGRSYLEIIAPDPDREQPAALPFGLESLATPRLAGWAIASGSLAETVNRARGAGYDPGRVRDMTRMRPDGVLLRWRLTADPPASPGFLVPFLIDWLGSPHPSESAPHGVRLVRLSAEHPDPAAVQPALDALGAGLTVVTGPEPALVALLDTPSGQVELH
ncbi:MAG TPA: VOC family protein [Candidatus Dormibacteraeota bacterium]|nr:VOC family protein [Candidatus Dormibacteraeota bacterium]